MPADELHTCHAECPCQTGGTPLPDFASATRRESNRVMSLQLQRPDRAELIQVIRTTLTRRGEGVEGDPVRIVTQYWSLLGNLLVEVDDCANGEPAIRSRTPK